MHNAAFVIPVLPVVAARRDGRERHSNFIRPVSPGQRDERRHGQTDVVLNEQARDGMTARGCEHSGHSMATEDFGLPKARCEVQAADSRSSWLKNGWHAFVNSASWVSVRNMMSRCSLALKTDAKIAPTFSTIPLSGPNCVRNANTTLASFPSPNSTRAKYALVTLLSRRKKSASLSFRSRSEGPSCSPKNRISWARISSDFFGDGLENHMATSRTVAPQAFRLWD